VFSSAGAFNGDLSAWNVGAVTTFTSFLVGSSQFIDYNSFCNIVWLNSVLHPSDLSSSGTTHLFCGGWKLHSLNLKGAVHDWCGTDAAKKNAVLDTYGSIETWDVSRATNLKNLFKNKYTCNANISAWNVGAVTNMGGSTYTLFSPPSLKDRDFLSECFFFFLLVHGC
jgi:hypothetical protein